MRSLLRLLPALFLLAGIAHAQILAPIVNFGAPRGGGATIGVTFSGGTNPNSTTTSTANVFAFASQPVGTSGLVVIGITQNTCTTACGIAAGGVTVGVTTATQGTSCYTSPSVQKATDIWYAAAPATSPQTISVTTANATGRVSIAVWNVTGAGAAFSTCKNNSNTSSATTSVSSLTVPSGGATIGFGSILGAETFSSASNLSTDAASTSCCGSNVVFAGHNTSLSGSQSFGITFSAANQIAGSFATFSP
jgi:hypothetical protein